MHANPISGLDATTLGGPSQGIDHAYLGTVERASIVRSSVTIETKSAQNGLGTVSNGTVDQMSDTWLDARWDNALSANQPLIAFVKQGERVLARVDTTVRVVPTEADWRSLMEWTLVSSPDFLECDRIVGSVGPVNKPRDQHVDPQWWIKRQPNHQRNIEYHLRQIADGVDGSLDAYCETLLKDWLARYSAGEELDRLVPEMKELLAQWIPVISDRRLFRFSFSIGALAHLVDSDSLLNGVDPSAGHSVQDRLSGWIFGDAGALESDEYTDPPKSGGIVDKRVDLARLAVADPVAAIEQLEVFVRKDWYRGSKGAGWWGSHNSRGEPMGGYTGYWCWEAAAIAHICGVDDSALNGHKYYPFDLVHFRDL